MPPRRRAATRRPKRAPARRRVKRQGYVKVSQPNKANGYIKRTRGRFTRVSRGIQKAIKYGSMIWKATRIMSDDVIAMAPGPIIAGAANRGMILSFIDNPQFAGGNEAMGIPLFDRASIIPQQADTGQSRGSNEIFVKAIKGTIAFNSTMNTQSVVRMICWQASMPSFLELYDPGYSIGNYPVLNVALGANNFLFESYITKQSITWDSMVVNPYQLATTKLNPELCKSKKDIFMDKLIDLKAYNVSGTSESAEVDNFMKISIDIPINRWVTYLESSPPAPVLNIAKQGSILLAILPAISINDANSSGAMTISYKLATVFKENT